MTVFVDTSVLFAAADSRDRWHARARELLEGLSSEPLLTTDHVVVETWMVLHRRYGRFHAMRFWRGLRGTPLGVEPVMLRDLERAEAIAEGWADQDFDIVDCTSFAVMERVGCRRAATFDRDFAVYRFGPDHKFAFEVLR
jgi:predicted nucleic acid-binding protein